MAAEHRNRPIPAYVVGLGSAAIVLVISLFGRHIDGSATMFTGGYLHVGVAIGWIFCAGLVALIVTRYVHKVGSVDEGAGLAVGYDALPILLLGAWIVMIAALATGHWLLAGVGAALGLYHLFIVVPRLIAARVPRWAKQAPTLSIVVANVFIDNETPDAAARQLVSSSADVVIVVESTAAFMQIFDDVGGVEAFPYRESDPDDHSDYAVTVACKREPGP